MREIKFRAWIKVSQKIASWEMIKEKKNLHRLIENPEYLLMQYTGLRDKNGVEIYEGDILKSDINETFGLVCFEDGKFVVNWENISEDLFEWTGEFVIGNIYEHSYLLDNI